MAVAFDAVGPSSVGASGAGVTSLTWTHTGVGSGLAIIAGGGCSVSGSTPTMTVGGVSATQLGKLDNGTGGSGFTQAFGIANVGSGAKSIVWTLNTTADATAGSTSFTGAGTTFGTAFGTPVTTSTTTLPDTVTVTGTTAGNIVAGLGSSGIQNTSITGQRWLINLNGNSAAGNAAGGDAAAGGSVGLTLSGLSDWNALVAAEVLASGGGSVDGVLRPTTPGQTWRRHFKHRQQLPVGIASASQQFTQPLNATLGFTSSDTLLTSTHLAGVLSFTGSLPKAVAVNLAAGALSFTGVVAKRTATLRSATLSFTGSVATLAVHLFTQALNATLGFTSSQTRRTGKSVSAAISFTSSQVRAVGKGISATIGFTGSLPRRTATNQAGAVSFSSSQTRRTAKNLGTTVLSFTGGVTTAAVHFFTQSLNASLSFTGSLSTAVAHFFTQALNATLSFAGSLTSRRTIVKALSASLSFTSSQTKRTGKLLVAGVSFTSGQTKRIAKAISAAVGLTGLLTRLSSAQATSGTASAAQMPVPGSTPGAGAAPTSEGGNATGPTSSAP